MTFPLWYFLVAYGIFFVICSFFLFFNFYHIARFGLQSTKTMLVLAMYSIAFAALLLGQIELLLTIDWTETVSISEAFFSTTPTF